MVQKVSLDLKIFTVLQRMCLHLFCVIWSRLSKEYNARFTTIYDNLQRLFDKLSFFPLYLHLLCQGIGALYVRRRPRVRVEALQSGGGQERGMRSGTVPAPLTVGLGAACEIAQTEMDVMYMR